MQNGNVVNCFEIAKFIVEIMLTIAAVVISIIALVQTKKQITLSNKQHLFDRRLEKYTIIEDILIQFDCIILISRKSCTISSSSEPAQPACL